MQNGQQKPLGAPHRQTPFPRLNSIQRVKLNETQVAVSRSIPLAGPPLPPPAAAGWGRTFATGMTLDEEDCVVTKYVLAPPIDTFPPPGTVATGTVLAAETKTENEHILKEESFHSINYLVEFRQPPAGAERCPAPSKRPLPRLTSEETEQQCPTDPPYAKSIKKG